MTQPRESQIGRGCASADLPLAMERKTADARAMSVVVRRMAATLTQGVGMKSPLNTAITLTVRRANPSDIKLNNGRHRPSKTDRGQLDPT
jgi:hypothetical protein